MRYYKACKEMSEEFYKFKAEEKERMLKFQEDYQVEFNQFTWKSPIIVKNNNPKIRLKQNGHISAVTKCGKEAIKTWKENVIERKDFEDFIEIYSQDIGTKTNINQSTGEVFFGIGLKAYVYRDGHYYFSIAYDDFTFDPENFTEITNIEFNSLLKSSYENDTATEK